MTYSVYQHWDPLKVCVVGRSYAPEFYSFIKNDRVRSVMERIAAETEEDYQTLIALLETFGVEIVRPTVSANYEDYLIDGKILPPPMTPRDYTAMIGEIFYMPSTPQQQWWNQVRGADWPQTVPTSVEEFNTLPQSVLDELQTMGVNCSDIVFVSQWVFLENLINNQGNKIIHNPGINAATMTRIGQDLYHGTEDYNQDQTHLLQQSQQLFPRYRNHVVNSGGHSDGTFCPVKPGLIISLYDIPSYAETFPGWEVVYLPGQSWSKVLPFLTLKEKNKGKWWVPGEELNDEFTNFVEEWLGHWVGYVEETVFDVNMLVINEHNVVCNNYNKQVFDAFARHNITPHVINFRHRYFWDGGLHCITSDLHREGGIKDYFPERG